ncbi:hypothetical protein L484_015357 [Morus notabilis]|uniref:Protein BRANCHLESS TRICHOME n=1 Tax=Morus notabilis TaxID=981085 RepID=W9RK95_9ROSA|nr:uncharacterized protein LOC21398458 [Morus notabilis]EXB81881.1 hypothetical protein L484_015357 [Morus notabilis]
MEEKKKTMMMTLNSPENPRNESSGEPITTSTCPTWKLYENPFYNSHNQPHHNHHNHNQHQNLTAQNCVYQRNTSLHQCLHLPLSARKLAASFWDLTFFTRPAMESELDMARTQIMELKTELEYERKARKKLESINKRLVKEAAEERRGREAMEKMCEELAKEISFDKAEISTMKREIEEERKMLRMSEVLREERVQMKLAEAKIVLEEKLLELECSKRIISECTNTSTTTSTTTTSSALKSKENVASRAVSSFSGKFRHFVMGEKWISNDEINNRVDSMASTRSVSSHDHNHNNNIKYSSSACTEDSSESVLSENCNNKSVPIFPRKLLAETENPHIKRGIKGFVEFPKVVRAVGSKNRQYWGTKLECQKAQLRILLKQKSPIRSNSLITS